MDKNTIAIVVPIFSDSRTGVSRIPLQRRLWISLKNQTDKDFLVIACDNDSFDNTESLFMEYFPEGVFVKHSPAGHRSGARNTGARAAMASHLIFMDCDLLAYGTFVANYRAFIDQHPDSIGIGKVINYWNLIHAGREFILGEHPNESIDYKALESSVTLRYEGSWIPDGERIADLNLSPGIFVEFKERMMLSTLFSIPKSLYFKLGGFDEDFKGWGHEDTYFSYICEIRKIYRFLINNTICIHQNHRPSDPNQVHWDDLASATKNEAIYYQKIKNIK